MALPAPSPGRSDPRRPLKLTALLLLWNLFALAQAHATFVFGQISVEPDPPRAGAPIELRLTLEDPSLTPVEDAIVAIELRPMSDPNAPLPAPSTEAPQLPAALAVHRLIESEAGVYRATFTLTEAGSLHLLVRDTTFPWEETNASVVLNVAAADDPEAALQGGLPFILPPTAVAPQSLWTWIAWLVGLPLVVGVVVTLAILRQGKRPAAA